MVFSRGQLGGELMWVVIALFIIGLGFVFVYPAFSDLNADIQGDVSISDEAKQVSQETAGSFANTWDGLVFWMLILFWSFLLIAAFFANTHPIFLMFTLILMILGLVVTMILANAYVESTEDDEVVTFAQEFPKLDWIMNHLLMIMVLVAGSTMLVLYAGSRS